jgi:hypothetical protein
MAERAIGLGEHGVGRLAEERVTKDVLGLAREATVSAARDDLTLLEHGEPLAHGRGLRGAAEQGHEPAAPEGLAEDAARAQQTARFGLEALEPGLDHGQHRLGEGARAAARGGADELLQVERVAVGALEQHGHGLGADVGAEDLSDEALARSSCQRAEADFIEVSLCPQGREDLVHLGPPEGQHQEGLLLEATQGRVDELHRGQVAPVQILQHEHHRLHLRLGREQVFPRAAHLVAHEQRVAARGPERHALRVREGRPAELAEELADTADLRSGDMPGDARAQLLLARIDGLAGLDARRAAQGVTEQAEGGACAHGIAARDPDLNRSGFSARGTEELVPHAGFSDAGRSTHEHDASDAFLFALGVDALQGRELAIAPHAHRGLAEHRARGLVGRALATELEAGVAAADLEASVEQARGHLVHHHGAPALRCVERLRGGCPGRRRRACSANGLPLGVDQARCAIDGLAYREAARDLAAPGGERDVRVGNGVAQPERAESCSCRLIGRNSRPSQGGDDDPAGQRLGSTTSRLDHGSTGSERVRRVGRGHRRRRLRCRIGSEEHVHRRRARVGIGGQREHDHAEQPLLAPREGLGPRRHRERVGDVHRAQRAELREHRGAVAWARVGLLRHHPRHEIVQRRGNVRRELAHPRRLVEQDLGEQPHHVLGHERGAPRQALEEHAPEREHVGARVQIRLPTGLLRRHVAGRAHEQPRRRRGARGLPDARDPEVEDLAALHLPAAEEQVPRLDVAVDDASRMRDGQRFGHAAAQLQALAHAQRRSRQAIAQLFALEPLHHEVGLPSRRDAMRNVTDDPGMPEAREQLGLACEAGAVQGRVALEHLDRHRLAARFVAGAVHVSHAARAGEAFDLEAFADDLARLHGTVG